MDCEDCKGTGEASGDKSKPCFRCDGTGTLCDVCGESCDTGLSICPDCEAEQD